MIYNWLPASDKREDNYIAGLSMGGRGTCVYAFSKPEKFAGAAVLSASPYDFSDIMNAKEGMLSRMKKSVNNYESLEAFMAGPENAWNRLTEKVGKGVLPELYFSTGGNDGVLKGLEPFMEYAKKIGLEATFEIIPGYSHEWRFWDLAIENTLNHFGIVRDAEAGNPY
jgi:putative tributyrin esterase